MSLNNWVKDKDGVRRFLSFIRSNLKIGQTASPIKSVSLHWGSHLQEYSLALNIKEFFVESSPMGVVAVHDPIIPNYEHRHAFNDRAICRLSGVTFFPDSGSVYVNGAFIRESQTDMPSYSREKCAQPIKIFNRPIIIAPFQTHYHWLIETLPRIIAAAAFEQNALIVASTKLGDTQLQALEHLGLEIFISSKCYSSDNLILATFGKDSGWPHPADLHILRRTFNIPSEIGKQKIFVSRVGSSRSDKLSEEIDEFAEKEGWTIVRAEEISWNDHLKIFGNASFIAGEHGAGLANIALAAPGTSLIELTRRDYANPCFAALSRGLNGDLSCYSSHDRESYREALLIN